MTDIIDSNVTPTYASIVNKESPNDEKVKSKDKLQVKKVQHKKDKSDDKHEDMVKEKSDDKPDVKPDDKQDDKPDVKPDDKPNDKPNDKPDVKQDDKPNDKPDDKPDDKPNDKQDDKPDVKPNDKPDDKPDDKPYNKSNGKPGYNGEDKSKNNFNIKQNNKPDNFNSKSPLNLMNNDRQKNNVKKIGRTLLIKILPHYTFNDSLIENLTGLVNKTNITTTRILFLTFNTNINALNALKQLKPHSYNNFYIKFSYYKLFFTLHGLTAETNYTETKKKLIEYISSKSDIQILYCKFYCKDNNYLGCGDLTVDTFDGMNKLLSKENGLKEFAFDNLSGVFYTYIQQDKRMS